MVSAGLKKLAKKHGMNVAAGVIYGDFYGYAATFSEESGLALFQLATRFTDPEKKDALLNELNRHDLQKEYRVLELNFTEKLISIRFQDPIGTWKKMIAFTQWFMPMLPEYGATGIDICPECMQSFQTPGKWKLVGGTAIYVHEACGEKIKRTIEMTQEQEKLEDTGSYLSGLLGALLGGVIGAIPWAIVLAAGYVAALVGLLIGWLAEMGYRLLHGKKGKPKILILILACILSVCLGTVLGDVISLAQMVLSGELPGYALGDIPSMMGLLFADAEYQGIFVKNLLMGLLFALLGMISILLKTHQETTGIQVKDLP